MNKIYKLFIDENIKTWKKFSTKLAILFILIALVGALGFVKLMQKMNENNFEIEDTYDWKESVKTDISIYKESLTNENLEDDERKSLENQIRALELNLKYNINTSSNDWKNKVLNQISMSSSDIDEKLVEVVEKDDFSGWIELQKEELKQQLDPKQINQEQYDNEIFILDLREKHEIGKTSTEEYEIDWRENILSNIRTAKESLRTGIDAQTNKVLTTEQKEKYENEIKIGIYRIENNIKTLYNTDEDNYRMIFEVLASGFVVTMIAVFAIIVAGGTISNEISTGTIKFWALTPNKRWKILTSKILSLLFYILVITLIMAVLTVACANIFFDTDGNIYLYVKDGNVKIIGNTLFIIEYYLAKIIPVVIFALFALMLSVITRNTSISLGLSAVVYMGNGIVMQILNLYIKKDWIKFVPFNNLNIADKIFPNFENPMAMFGKSFATSTSLGFSLGVLGVCAILMLVTMYDSFNKRDIV